MALTVNWQGDQLKRNVAQAAKFAIDQTTGACVRHAVPNTPVSKGHTRGALRRSIRAEPAVIRGNMVTATWGSFQILYAIFQEAGTRYIRAKYFLRGAADAEYPNLEDRIGRRLG